MNDFEKYVYFYKDINSHWCIAKNPVFIASHTRCRAVALEEILKKFNNPLQLKNKLNDYHKDEKAENFVNDTILYEIR